MDDYLSNLHSFCFVKITPHCVYYINIIHFVSLNWIVLNQLSCVLYYWHWNIVQGLILVINIFDWEYQIEKPYFYTNIKSNTIIRHGSFTSLRRKYTWADDSLSTWNQTSSGHPQRISSSSKQLMSYINKPKFQNWLLILSV